MGEQIALKASGHCHTLIETAPASDWLAAAAAEETDIGNEGGRQLNNGEREGAGTTASSGSCQVYGYSRKVT